jgi:hypothetical protein
MMQIANEAKLNSRRFGEKCYYTSLPRGERISK